LARAASSGPMLACRCESVHPDGLDRLRGELRRHLQLSGVEAQV